MVRQGPYYTAPSTSTFPRAAPVFGTTPRAAPSTRPLLPTHTFSGEMKELVDLLRDHIRMSDNHYHVLYTHLQTIDSRITNRLDYFETQLSDIKTSLRHGEDSCYEDSCYEDSYYEDSIGHCKCGNGRVGGGSQSDRQDTHSEPSSSEMKLKVENLAEEVASLKIHHQTQFDEMWKNHLALYRTLIKQPFASQDKQEEDPEE